MTPFCLSLGVSHDSLKRLSKIINILDKTASDRDAFLHTTIFQGISESIGEISDWATRDGSFIQEKKIKSSLSLWDVSLKYSNDLNA